MEDITFMTKSIVVDTNLLLDDPKIIFKLLKKYDKILVPIIVLKELDKHKYNPNLAFSARNAIRTLSEFKLKNPDKISFPMSDIDIPDNDAKIIDAAKKENADLATKDISMSMIADSKGVNTKLYNVIMNNLFEPYNYIKMKDIYKYYETFGFSDFYNDEDYDKIISLFSKILEKELDKNSWFFVFIQTENLEPCIYANHPINENLIRIDCNYKYRELKCNSGRTIKARDIYQICAMYVLEEAPHCLITGKWGSGKSLLSSAYAFQDEDKKAFITRPPIGINAKYDIGFLPGSKDEKMMDWLAGFTSSLYYIYGNTKNNQKDGKSGFDYVKENLFYQKYEVLPLNSIQGLSLLDSDVLMVDEIQLIDIDHMSMILSRPTENGKLIMMGDLKQTYSIVKPGESGLLKLLRILPHRSMAYVRLENSYRSDILELADDLQDRTI